MCPHLLTAGRLRRGQAQLETGGQGRPRCFSPGSRQIGRVGLAEQTDGSQHPPRTGNASPWAGAPPCSWCTLTIVLTEFTSFSSSLHALINTDSFTGKVACRQVLKAWNCAERQPEPEGQLCFTCKKQKNVSEDCYEDKDIIYAKYFGQGQPHHDVQ